jgi:predicted PurR-regulated permease PerM
MLRWRLRRPAPEGEDDGPTAGAAAQEEVIELEPGVLSEVFAAPKWMRDLGFSAWLLVGAAAALIGAIWLLGEMQTIVMPVLTAGIIAAVFTPLVDLLQKRRIPRAAGAALVLLGIVVIGVALGLLILGGISSQAASLSSKLRDGADQLETWAHDAGVGAKSAGDAKQAADASTGQAFTALTHGLVQGIDALASLAVFVTFTVLSLFFLLKDSASIGAYVEGHLGVPVPVARTVLRRVAGSLRGYFLGVTIVSLWSSLIVGAGAVLIGVPLAGTIAVVTFVGGYVPYLGAWTAGAFAVLIALGDGGASEAVALGIVVLLANGILQQLVQPIAYGATLGLHPLAVLIVTIAGGCLFGTVGLVLAAPLLSAAVRIAGDLRGASAREPAVPAAV